MFVVGNFLMSTIQLNTGVAYCFYHVDSIGLLTYIHFGHNLPIQIISNSQVHVNVKNYAVKILITIFRLELCLTVPFPQVKNILHTVMTSLTQKIKILFFSSIIILFTYKISFEENYKNHEHKPFYLQNISPK